ncbi:uncharacterized protein KGF55_004106 [Candida pseudojiufengensis]|uniref:uncharacterized protein n=1 Tax=Candida pseudojiufengensis TaxID=497109 RepID=UPI0022252948|nr:uncharacterized protein KGF55_004106 [Candida pseudojiufengensis]KAI5961181.1 hypothetical protein KGF55_004106 [Candida pseudojiufengensis]
MYTKSKFDDEDDQGGGNKENTLHDTNNNKFKNSISIRSIYHISNIPTVSTKGKVWPLSKFEKIDVLKCAINGKNIEYLQNIEKEIKQSMMIFPAEIFAKIFDLLDSWGQLKPKFMRVCKLFYVMILPLIYKNPYLRGTNFLNFVETLSNNKKLGNFIHALDLAYVIQSGKNAFVARLLKQSRKNLEVFVAPQTSFGFGPLVALKNCSNLKILDLRLVSETLNLTQLFHSIENLKHLTHLSFPRSSIDIEDHEKISWPPKLSFLRLSGGINDDFLYHSNFPNSITNMEFAHCPAITDLGLKQVLYRIGNQLTTLKIQYPMPALKNNSLDEVFIFCPNLRVLEVSVDYLSSMFFDDQYLGYANERPLRTMYINSSGMLGTTTKLDPMDLAVAIEDGRLPLLKNIQCTAKLGWDPKSEAVTFIADELDERGGGLYIGY